MPKGKPWTVQEERKLRDLRVAGKTVAEIAILMGKSVESIRMKLKRSGFTVKVDRTKNIGEGSTTTELIMPDDLISIEESLQIIVSAMNKLKTPNLSKNEVLRLKAIINAAVLYQRKFAEYVNYRKIEANLIDLTEKYEAWAEREREKSKADSDSGSEEEGR